MDVSIVVYMFIGSITIDSNHNIEISDDIVKKDFTDRKSVV